MNESSNKWQKYENEIVDDQKPAKFFRSAVNFDDVQSIIATARQMAVSFSKQNLNTNTNQSFDKDLLIFFSIRYLIKKELIKCFIQFL